MIMPDEDMPIHISQQIYQENQKQKRNNRRNDSSNGDGDCGSNIESVRCKDKENYGIKKKRLNAKQLVPLVNDKDIIDVYRGNKVICNNRSISRNNAKRKNEITKKSPTITKKRPMGNNKQDAFINNCKKEMKKQRENGDDVNIYGIILENEGRSKYNSPINNKPYQEKTEKNNCFKTSHSPNKKDNNNFTVENVTNTSTYCPHYVETFGEDKYTYTPKINKTSHLIHKLKYDGVTRQNRLNQFIYEVLLLLYNNLIETRKDKKEP